MSIFLMEKRYILFLFLSLYSICTFANETLKKEKKELIEFIKSEYDSWSNISQDSFSSRNHTKGNSSLKLNDLNGEIGNTSHGPSKKHTSLKSYSDSSVRNFKDFDFTIVDNQAVVRFTVDNQTVSAFLEKENGKWKLVCAAKLDLLM